MAPEILRGEQYIAASDVYSFGVVMWVCFCHAFVLLVYIQVLPSVPCVFMYVVGQPQELVTGKIPFEGLSPVVLIGMAVRGLPSSILPQPPASRATPKVCELLNQTMHPSPEER